MKVCVVIPVYNEEATLEPLAGGIAAELGAHDCRILFVDDGSTDGSAAVLRQLREADRRIAVITFARNRGKTLALAAAFARVDDDTDVVVTMDADLQDDPVELPRLLAKLEEGYDLVCGWKAHRQDPLHKTVPSKMYNSAINTAFGLAIHDVNTGYKAMRLAVARSLTLYADMHRLVPIMAAQAGFRVTEIPVRHHPRRFGHSKYGISRFYEGIRDACRLGLTSREARQAAAQAALDEARRYIVDGGQ